MLKNDVLDLFSTSRDHAVSGEEIARTLGVSRAAVNQAVSSLRADGYVIEAATRKGYRLLSRPDVLSEAEILPALNREGNRFSLQTFTVIDSTNDWLKMHFRELPDFTAAVADQQTGGRGRMGRSFVSPKGAGVYLSVLLKPLKPLSDFRCITAMTAVAAADAVEEVSGVRPGIKWPNDLVMNGKKIAGILTEMSLEGETGALQYIVVGIGVNLFPPEDGFPETIADKAAALFDVPYDEELRKRFLKRLLLRFKRYYEQLPDITFYDTYRNRMIGLGGKVLVAEPDGMRYGTSTGIDREFRLIVRYEDGTEAAIDRGDVTFV